MLLAAWYSSSSVLSKRHATMRQGGRRAPARQSACVDGGNSVPCGRHFWPVSASSATHGGPARSSSLESAMAYTRPASPSDPVERLLGEDPAMQALRAQIRHLSRFDAIGHATVPTVVLQGATGTGKGLVARVIH